MQEQSALGRAIARVSDLRARCAWDRAQTRDTLRPYLVEEVHELDHALGRGDPAAIRAEVSDLLLHLAWQLVLAREAGEFEPDDVAGDLEQKMRRRHPHLFELGPREPWEQLKRREARGGILEGLPPTLPALLMAFRLQERAAATGFDWPDPSGPAAKVREELVEVEHELARPTADPTALEHEIGDLLFSVVNLARKAGVAPDPALERANIRFRERFRAVERLADARGIALHRCSIDELDALWDEVKQVHAGGHSAGTDSA
jgi:MazG family protein